MDSSITSSASSVAVSSHVTRKEVSLLTALERLASIERKMDIAVGVAYKEGAFHGVVWTLVVVGVAVILWRWSA